MREHGYPTQANDRGLPFGLRLAAAFPKDQVVQIKDPTIVPLAGGEVAGGIDRSSLGTAYTINPKRQPKAIDLNGRVPGLGIYRLEGNRLTLCVGEFQHRGNTMTGRPANFDVPPDKDTARIVLRRSPGGGQAAPGEAAAGGGPVETPSRPPKAEIDQVRRQIDAFNTALALYREEWGDFPPNEQGLKALLQPIQRRDDGTRPGGTWIKAVPLDPWGHPYQYRHPSSHGKVTPDIWSNGPDGKPIGSWEK